MWNLEADERISGWIHSLFSRFNLPKHSNSQNCFLVYWIIKTNGHTKTWLPFINTVNIVYETDEQPENFSCCLLDSEEENTLSSEDEIDIECEILEKERDEANEKLSRMEEASAQLLKELDVLEMQFQIERSCRETAESFALKVNKDFKALKRQSQAILPLIPEMPENFSILNLDPEADPSSETVSEEENSEDPLLMSQNQIRELQSSVDRLLGEKIQLTAQVELLKKEKEDLKDKLVLEVREKEALLRKQSRTVNKMKRVSQLVTEEFTEMSQKFEMEQGLRQHAEVFAHQMLVKQQETQRQIQNAENEKQLQQALSQVTKICKALEEIRLYYQNQMSQTAAQDLNSLSDLAAVRTKLEISEKERSETEIQLRDSKQSVTALQEEIKLLKDKLKEMEQLPSIQSIQLNEAKENPADPPSLVPPAPPPPPPPPPSSHCSSILDEYCVDLLTEPAITEDMKARAVDEMMERIKKGIILKPILRTPQVGLSLEQRSDNRKSAVLELQEMLVSTRRPGPRRVESKKRFSRNVGEAELQMVLQRRRRAMGDEKGTPPSPSKPKAVSVSSSSPWAGESGSAPVLRRLQQNREKRISRIKASESIIWEEK
uniref:Shootin-1-like n=1 Tax=Sinocyclocheilus anshuiensis TaxID=1608454 RepID=A0A671SPP2_9TELE